MLRIAEVEIRRDIDPAGLNPISDEQAASEDGLDLNHDYFDVRDHAAADLADILEAEGEILTALEAENWDEGLADELVDQAYEDCSAIGPFDLGVGAAVIALAAAGATPISSCNAGVIDGRHHAAEIPNILFSVSPEGLPIILRAATAADIGLINNDGYAELFTDRLPKFHDFARYIATMLGAVGSS